MLEKELAQATKMASQANNKVEQLRKKLVAESEKSHAKAKRELQAARKRHTTANKGLCSARDAFKKKATPACGSLTVWQSEEASCRRGRS